MSHPHSLKTYFLADLMWTPLHTNSYLKLSQTEVLANWLLSYGEKQVLSWQLSNPAWPMTENYCFLWECPFFMTAGHHFTATPHVNVLLFPHHLSILLPRTLLTPQNSVNLWAPSVLCFDTDWQLVSQHQGGDHSKARGLSISQPITRRYRRTTFWKGICLKLGKEDNFSLLCLIFF